LFGSKARCGESYSFPASVFDIRLLLTKYRPTKGGRKRTTREQKEKIK
jgi:hypothetical protein